eukprot:6208884-Pleurochrysis_carterae.AAC.5
MHNCDFELGSCQQGRQFVPHLLAISRRGKFVPRLLAISRAASGQQGTSKCAAKLHDLSDRTRCCPIARLMRAPSRTKPGPIRVVFSANYTAG